MLTLRLDGITLSYGSRMVLKDINLEVQPGEIAGVIGPNGSGKSTLIRSIAKTIAPVSGRIFIDGYTIDRMSSSELARIVAVMSQNTKLPDLFTAFELVLMGRTPHLGLFRYESKNDMDIVKKAMDDTNTAHLAFRHVNELSGGEKQRILLARALAQEPSILLLDEPTANLDINNQVETLDLIRRLCRDQKLIVLIALHDLNLAAQYCDRLAILYGGAIYKQGTPEEVVNADIIKTVYGADVLVYPHPVNNLPATLIVPKTK
jgi:iron complex transport system ATP-binding protein